MAIDTDKIRKDLPPKDKPQLWVEAKLHQALDEIDRLRKQLKAYPNYEKR